jgi:phage I-like protein
MDLTRIRLDDRDTYENISLCVDLSGFNLSEGKPTWIQATKIGVFQHPLYGKLDFSLKELNKYIQNFRLGVRGQELNIDFGHEEFRDDAAGWVKDVEIRTNEPDPEHNGLWYLVEWTDEGSTSLTSKRYRYFSIDFSTKWKDPTGKVFTNILNGGALTNRPYIKGMKPITLSELNLNERKLMDRAALEALAKSLGVEFDESTTDEALNTLVSEAALSTEDDESDVEEEEEVEVETEDDLVGQLTETDRNNPLIQTLLAERRENAARLQRLETANRLSETNRKLTELKASTKLALTPKAEGKLKAIMLSAPDAIANGIFDMVKDILEDGTRQLGELGSNATQSNKKTKDSDTTLSDFETEVKKLTEGEGKISYSDAIDQIASERPDLYMNYLENSVYGGTN